MPEKIRAMQDKAHTLVESGNYAEAVALLSEIVETNPGNSDARYLLGVCQNNAAQLDKAEASFKAVVAAHPGHHQAYYGLGLVLEKKDKHADAIQAWKQCLRIHPGFDYAARKLAQYGANIEEQQKRQTGTNNLSPPVDDVKKKWLDSVLPGIHIPADLKYTDQHVWIKRDDGLYTIGITDFHRFTRNTEKAWIEDKPKVGEQAAVGQVLCTIKALMTTRGPKKLYANPKGKSFSFKPKTLKELDHRSWKGIPLISPMSGRIVAYNKKLAKQLLRGAQEFVLVNDPYRQGWIMRLESNAADPGPSGSCMDAAAYRLLVGSILLGNREISK